MTELVRHATILKKVHETKHGILFNHPVEEGEDRDYTAITLDRALWEDFGSPDEITIWVVPGDYLNKVGADPGAKIDDVEVQEEDLTPQPEVTVADYISGKKDGEMHIPKVDYRSASTGKFVTEGEAMENPETTVKETS